VSGAKPKCQLFVFDSSPGSALCQAEVSLWRECGAGCKPRLVIAYCDAHGGDRRAAEEMEKHVAEVHR
jgi:hypothetical protein